MRTAWLASTGVLVRLALIILWGVSLSHAAYSQTPTPAQMEVFRNLPPDQQRAVLEAMQGGSTGVVRRDPQLSSPAPSIDLPEQPSPPIEVGPPRLGPGSTVVLNVTLKDESVNEQSRAQVQSRRDRIHQGNPYRLDNQGRISLPLTPPINLTGLTDAQAAQLLNSDARLAGLQFSVALLPVKPSGAEALKPFGYDLFQQTSSTFAPAADIPVPGDYRLGPGDNVIIDLFGKKTGRYELVVDRNGNLTLPEFGPIQVAGLSFDDVRAEVQHRVSEQMIGVRASVTMGQLRSIRVFVVGDVVRPGTYTVSGLSTITHALYASGGVSKIGSLRNIELKRGGQTVTRLDLYDLLLRGDTSRDELLRQGDAIFVPPVGSTAGIAGEVRRPAIYEFRAGSTVAELLHLAGGLTPAADTRMVRLERIGADRQRTVVNLDLSKPADRAHELRPGDVLIIPKVFDETRGVTLEGHVQRPGPYAWHEGMRLTDLLSSMQMFKVNADQRYVLIRREHRHNRRVEVLSADAVRAFEAKGSEHDPQLHSGDRVIVFDRQSDRGNAMSEVLKELQLQARDNSPLPVVSIFGRVRAPGRYPLEQNMTVADLVRAGGGLDEAAYGGVAELARYEVVAGEARKTEVLEVNLADASSERGRGLALRPYDVLVVKETPSWREQESVTLRGEVRFPGTYPIRKNETLSSIIERAGGLTDEAFPEGTVFMREEIKEQERQQIERLASRLESELTFAVVQNAQAKGQNTAEILAAGQSLLAQLRDAPPTGRLVVDLERALENKGGDEDIPVADGDEIVIPRLKPYVTVIGEVQNATAHVWKRGLSRDDYVKMSGGTTQRADKSSIYVVRANGSVVSSGGRWFGGKSVDLQPGDTIVVPVDTERMSPLALWTAVTTIIYNMGVAVAAIGSL